MRRVGLRVPAGMRVSGPVRLDGLAQQQVRELWWRNRRYYNVDLPPEHGVILIHGGRE